MKLRTSFFNTTVLKKDITRFAPVWGLYTLFVGLFLLLMWEVEDSVPRFAANAPYILSGMGLVNFFYAPLAAFCVFCDLFKSRMCNALHALPLRREGWFLTHFTAGMLFSLVPNGFAGLLCAAMLGEFAYAALLWLSVMVLQYLFFFGVSVFAVQCSGNHLGSIAVYGIVNFLAVIAGWLIAIFYEPLLYGVRITASTFAAYSPVVRFTGARYLYLEYDNLASTAVYNGLIGEDWRFLGISAIIGVALIACAVLIYRKRQLESAGDLICFKPAAPVFLVVYTLCVGAVLYVVAHAIAEPLGGPFLLVGFAVGFFTGKMLLDRNIKVFRGKTLISFGVLVAVFLVSLGIVSLDPLGITRYVPEQEQITSVTICPSHYEYDIRTDSATLTDPDEIREIMDIHQSCIEFSGGAEDMDLYICYQLKGGATVKRYYSINPTGETAKKLTTYFSSPQTVFNGMNPSAVLEKLRWIEVCDYNSDVPLIAIATHSDYLDISFYLEKYGASDKCKTYLTDTPATDPVLTELFRAMEADCAAGNMSQSYQLQNSNVIAGITLQYHDGRSIQHLDLQIYETCENTMAYLKTLQTK